MKKLKTLLFCILAVMIGCCSFALAACQPDEQGEDPTTGTEDPGTDGPGADVPGTDEPGTGEPAYDGLFANKNGLYTLSADYVISAEDAENTAGEGQTIELGICAFDLGGHTLDLGGYELSISSAEQGEVIFENGNIVNGTLNISVPNGDISFTAVTLAQSVTYELEAASDTIRFSNALIAGSCTVKSDTRVQIEYSSVSDITLAGNGNLFAGDGAELGDLTVSTAASGAQVIVSPSAKVSSVELNATANVSVAGSVSSVTVAEAVKDDAGALTIDVTENATIDQIELNAAATVSVAGSVSSVTVTDTVKDDAAALAIDVAESANITQIELNASASVNVAGSVNTVRVAQSSAADELNITVSGTATVAKVELNATANVEVSGAVGNMVVNKTAANSSVRVNDSASITTIAVTADEITINAAENADISNVYVTENVNTANINVDTTTATDEEMEGLIAHTHVMVVLSRTEPTCTKAGNIHYECACGETQDVAIPALGHKEVYTVITQPTATQPGLGRYVCVRCGATRDVTIEQTPSLVIEGLEWIFAQIPDGTYVLAGDENAPVSITPGGSLSDDTSITVNEFEAILEVNDGQVVGTISMHLTVRSYGDVTHATMRAVFDGNTLFVYTDADIDGGNGEENSNTTVAYGSMSMVIRSLILQMTGLDIDEVYADYASLIEDLVGDEDSSLADAIIGQIIDKAFVTSEQDGNTVYTFSAEKLDRFLKELNTSAPADLLDEALGEGTYADLRQFAARLSDMTVSEVLTEIFSMAENAGISQEQLLDIAETALSSLLPSPIDLETLILKYSDRTVAWVAAMSTVQSDDEVTDEMVANAKQNIDGLVGELAAVFENGTISDLVRMLNEMGLLPPNSSYEQLVALIDRYDDGATLVATVDPEGNLCDLSVTYEQPLFDANGEVTGTGAALTLTWTAGNRVPEIIFELNEDTLSLTDENGVITISAAIADSFQSLTYTKTETGAEINYIYGITTSAGEMRNVADILLAVTQTARGAELDLSGTIHNDPNGSDYEQSHLLLDGTLHANRDDSATVDEDIRDSFAGERELLYHMDKTFVRIGSTYADVLDISYVLDDTGEYYLINYTTYRFEGMTSSIEPGKSYTGTLTTIAYQLKTGSANGYPELPIASMPDCGDWIQLNIGILGKGTVTQTWENGTFVLNADGTVTTIQSVGKEVSTSPAIFTMYGSMQSFTCYYNTATGETATRSQHHLTYSAVLAEGSERCEDGLLVTERCTECGYARKFISNGHYYDGEATVLETQCGSYSSITLRTCIYCGDEYLSYSINEHRNLTESRKTILSDEEYNLYLNDYYESYLNRYESDEAMRRAEADMEEQYVRLSALGALGLATDGFYSGYAEAYHCAICGLNVSVYQYYTNPTGREEDCTYRESLVFDYKGNAGYEAFHYQFSAASSGHDYVNEYDNTITVSQAIAIAKDLIGSMPFAPTDASLRRSVCPGCGKVSSMTLYFYDNYGTELDLYIDYDEDSGELYAWNYSLRTYDLDKVADMAEKFAAYYDGIASYACDDGRADLYVWWREDSRRENAQIYLYGADGGNLEINYDIRSSLQSDSTPQYDGYLEISEYIYAECLVEEITYSYTGNSAQPWEYQASSSYEQHDYGYQYAYGENCNEDGWYSYSYCVVCGDRSGNNFEPQYYHEYTYSGSSVSANNWQLKGTLFEGDVSGLSAVVDYGAFCADCGTLIDVQITLTGNWTLTEDVYIKAEYITLDLNGCVIDLNGHNLIIYSYQTSSYGDGRVTLTDSEYDTSVSGGAAGYIFDSTGEEGEDGIPESGDGMLVIFTNSGDIVGGTATVYTQLFASDCDNRYTIYDSVYQSNGVRIPILIEDDSMFTEEADLAAATHAPDDVTIYSFSDTFDSFEAGSTGAVAESDGHTVAVMMIYATLEKGQTFSFDFGIDGYDAEFLFYVDGAIERSYQGEYSDAVYYTAYETKTYQFMIVYQPYSDSDEYNALTIGNISVT